MPWLPRTGLLNMLYIGLLLKTIWKLHLVQNVATWTVMGACQCAYVLHVPSELHWLPFGFWVQLKALATTYKILYGIKPGYLSNHSFLIVSVHLECSGRKGELQVLSIKYYFMGAGSMLVLSIGAPPLWRNITPKIRALASLLSFQKILKTWL